MSGKTSSDGKCVMCASACCASRVARVALDEVASICTGCESVVTGLILYIDVSTLGSCNCVLLSRTSDTVCWRPF